MVAPSHSRSIPLCISSSARSSTIASRRASKADRSIDMAAFGVPTGYGSVGAWCDRLEAPPAPLATALTVLVKAAASLLTLSSSLVGSAIKDADGPPLAPDGPVGVCTGK